MKSRGHTASRLAGKSTVDLTGHATSHFGPCFVEADWLGVEEDGLVAVSSTNRHVEVMRNAPFSAVAREKTSCLNAAEKCLVACMVLVEVDSRHLHNTEGIRLVPIGSLRVGVWGRGVVVGLIVVLSNNEHEELVLVDGPRCGGPHFKFRSASYAHSSSAGKGV